MHNKLAKLIQALRAALIPDTWQTLEPCDVLLVRHDGGGSNIVDDVDLGYPKSIVLQDGRIFTVYYFNAKGTNCFIAGSFYLLPKSKQNKNILN